MLFNSQIFVFVFLPVVWVLYFGLHHLQMHRTAKVFLTLASLVFYGYYNIAYVGLLLGSILFNYGVYLLLGRLRKQDGGVYVRQQRRQASLQTSLSCFILNTLTSFWKISMQF